MTSHVVVVESPAKAKTINKYLGKDFTVLASYGHVRDLPSKDGSVKPDEDFAMIYEVDADAKKNVSAIAKAVKGCNTLYLATDPDREGEAIAWHVLEALKESNAIKKDVTVKRVAFYEITKKAVTEAIANPRDIDMDLVNAQQARRALDYLVGFTLSPVLWRKLPGSRSAGRVQSVALRLICEREQEIEAFISQEYWDIEGQFSSSANMPFKARLANYAGEKLEKFSITHEAQAKQIEAALRSKQYSVSTITPKQAKRNPYAPFATSTLQMDASRKLGFSAKKTMQLAQKLYEGVSLGGETVGLITYMRTDAISISMEALVQARAVIESDYGKKYLPDSPRMYKTKSKNAQEAHEAIRPTDLSRTSASVKQYLDDDMWRLYDLIWKRTLASQMEAAVYDQVVAEIESSDKQAGFRAVGSVRRFDGFLTLYNEAHDDDEADEEDRRLPDLKVGESVKASDILPAQHFTEPPPRFSEASLVKRLEELGIGRPSTYASIISTLVDRKYVLLDKKRFTPEPLGRLVSAFLVSFFEHWVEYHFTAQMEDTLDDISNGERNWKDELRKFWEPFIAKIQESQKLTTTDVLEALDKVLEPFTFGTGDAVAKARTCPSCGSGRLSLKTGKWGAFLGCSNYPDCNYTRQILTSGDSEEGAADANQEFPRTLGKDPATSEDITIRKGPYGVYVQLGESKKPKRASLPKGTSANDMTLEKAIQLLSLPREVGHHPESGQMILAGLGRFGPYLLHDKIYTSLKGEDDVLTIGMNRAVTLISENKKKKGVEPLRVLGKHPEDGEDISVFEGRYGAYVKHGKVNATIPKDSTPESITLEEAIPLVAQRSGSAKGKKGKKAAPKAKAAPKEKAAAKAPAKAKTKAAPKAKKKAS